MGFQRFGIVALGLVLIAGSAHATTSYCAACGVHNQAAFNTATTSLYAVAPLSGFAGTFTGVEYDDPISGAQFLDFSDNSGVQGAAANLSIGGTILHASTGGIIEILLPLNTLAIQINVSATGSGSTFCLDTVAAYSAPGCDVGQQVSGPLDVEFLGVTNGAAFSKIWVGPSSSSPGVIAASTIAINSFQIFTDQAPVPEASTMLLIGLGLIVLHLFHRRRRANIVG
jgi:PEP-CTERM motif